MIDKLLELENKNKIEWYLDKILQEINDDPSNINYRFNEIAEFLIYSTENI